MIFNMKSKHDTTGAIRAALDAADALSARALRSAGIPVRPRLATVNVTDRCNCRCTICDIHKRPATDELTPDDYHRLFSDPAAARIRVVRLTGGEPFIRGDMAKIAAAALAAPELRFLHITTNGGFPDRAAAVAEAIAAKAPGALHIQVSLDALDTRHDDTRGVSGALANALETLEKLSALRRGLDFHFGINQTVMPGTLDQMRPIGELSQRLGAGHSIFLAARHHEGKDYRSALTNGRPLPFEPQLPMSKKQIKEFYSVFEEIKTNAYHSRIRRGSPSAALRDLSEEYINDGGRSRLLHNRNEPAPPCMAMFTHLRVTASGDIISCSALSDVPAGNLRRSGFGEIWQSAESKRLRRRVASCPGCWIECDINPSIFFSGDIALWAVRRAAADPSFRRAFIEPLLAGKE